MTSIERYTCEDAFRRLDDYLDRFLTEEERRKVEEHLHACEACAREFRFEAAVVEDVRHKLKRIMAPTDLLERITQRLSQVRPDRSVD
jgi:anti-sigma factor (TIGR02949 family)